MDKFVKDIFEILVKILPSDWGKITLHMALGNNSHSMMFFVMDPHSARHYSFVDLQKLGIFTKYEFQNVSMRIGSVSREYQKTFEKKWTGYTLVISRDGTNFVDFEFEQKAGSVSEDWKNRYLK